MRPALRLVLAAGIWCAPLGAWAQGPTAASAEIDVAIPAAPGFAVLGIEPSQVIDPSATRISTLDLSSFVGADGKLKVAPALSGSPYFWFQPGLTLDRYRSVSNFERIIARTQVSVGFAPGAKDEPDRIGVGFTTELLGSADYRMDDELYRCVRDVHHKYFAPSGPPGAAEITAARNALAADPNFAKLSPALQMEAINEYLADHANTADSKSWAQVQKEHGKEYATETEQCRHAEAVRFAAKPSWTIAGGAAWKGDPTNVTHQKPDGGAVWTSYKIPLASVKDIEATGIGARSITLFGRYDFDRRAAVAGGEQKFDHLLGAIVGGYTWTSGMKLSGQIGYERVDYRNAGPNKDSRSALYGASFSYPLRAGLWLEVKAGASKSNPAAPGDHDSRVTATIHIAPPKS